MTLLKAGAPAFIGAEGNFTKLSNSLWHGFNKTQQPLAFLQPEHGIGGALHVTDHAVNVNHYGGGALDEYHRLLQPIPVIYVTIRVSQDGERQMRAIGITPGFFQRVSQNQQNLTTCRLEFFI